MLQRTTSILAITLVAAACGPDDKKTKTPAGLLGQACASEGSATCDNALQLNCINGVWELGSDCSLQGLACSSPVTGAASCTVDNSGCDFIGHTPAVAMAFYDPDLLPQWDMFTIDSAQSESVEMLIAPNTMPGTYDLSSSTSFPMSTVTGLGLRLNGMAQTSYVVTSGQAEITQIDQTIGGQVIADLTDIKYAEATISGSTISLVPGGKTWCIDQLTITAQVGRYWCFVADSPMHDLSVGESTCFQNGNQLATCSPLTAMPNDPGELTFQQTCANGCAEPMPGQAQCM